MKRFLIAVVMAAVMISGGHPAAQSYPARTVSLVVPSAPGGATDIFGRMIARELELRFKRPVIVTNNAGAGGLIGTESVARAAADGHTLLLGYQGVITVNPVLHAKISYDPEKDFTPVSILARLTFVLSVHPSVKANSVKELIALAKTQPGKLTFASAGIGAPPHLAGELLKTMAGIDIVHVPYKGTGPAIADLVGGQVTMMFSDALAAVPQIKAGKLRGLAVSSPRRFAFAPDLPTVAESGVPGFSAVGWTGLLAPAGTQRAVVHKLNAEIVRVLPLPDVREKLAGNGSEFGKNTPEEFSTFIKDEIAKWGKVVKESGARAD